MALCNATSISFQAFCKVLDNFGLRLDTWSFYRHCDIMYVTCMMPSSPSFKSLLYRHSAQDSELNQIKCGESRKVRVGPKGRVDWLVNFCEDFPIPTPSVWLRYRLQRLFHTYQNFTGCDPFQISQTKNERHSDESHHHVRHELMRATMTPVDRSH